MHAAAYWRRQVCHQVEVTWHTGRGAAAAAAAFGVVSLPAIVYQPPNCAEREKPRDDCRCGTRIRCLPSSRHPCAAENPDARVRDPAPAASAPAPPGRRQDVPLTRMPSAVTRDLSAWNLLVHS